MNYPSVNTIMKGLNIDKARARTIRKIMEGPGLVAEDNSVLQLSRMERINRVLGTFGVEYIPEGRNLKSPPIHYCNTGEPYQRTVLKIRSRFHIGCWGDLVERGNYD